MAKKDEACQICLGITQTVDWNCRFCGRSIPPNDSSEEKRLKKILVDLCKELSKYWDNCSDLSLIPVFEKALAEALGKNHPAVVEYWESVKRHEDSCL